jgi:hypothetical protein
MYEQKDKKTIYYSSAVKEVDSHKLAAMELVTALSEQLKAAGILKHH